MNNLILLAKLFDKFLEVGDSFVEATEIKAIRKTEAGVEIITPYGNFTDSIDYEALKTKIDTIQQTLKAVKEDQGHLIKIVQDQLANSQLAEYPPMGMIEHRSIKDLRVAGQAELAIAHTNVPTPRVIPLGEVGAPCVPLSAQSVTIEAESPGTNGTLYDDKSLMVVNRQDLVIKDPMGIIIATGTAGGTVIGDTCSGIVYENGKFTLAFKKYPHPTATVEFSVKSR